MRRPATLFAGFVVVSLLTRWLSLVVGILDTDEAAHAVGSWVLLDGAGSTRTSSTTSRPSSTPTTPWHSSCSAVGCSRSTVHGDPERAPHGARRLGGLSPRPARRGRGAALARLRGQLPGPRHAGRQRRADPAAPGFLGDRPHRLCATCDPGNAALLRWPSARHRHPGEAPGGLLAARCRMGRAPLAPSSRGALAWARPGRRLQPAPRRHLGGLRPQRRSRRHSVLAGVAQHALRREPDHGCRSAPAGRSLSSALAARDGAPLVGVAEQPPGAGATPPSPHRWPGGAGAPGRSPGLPLLPPLLRARGLCARPRRGPGRRAVVRASAGAPGPRLSGHDSRSRVRLRLGERLALPRRQGRLPRDGPRLPGRGGAAPGRRVLPRQPSLRMGVGAGLLLRGRFARRATGLPLRRPRPGGPHQLRARQPGRGTAPRAGRAHCGACPLGLADGGSRAHSRHVCPRHGPLRPLPLGPLSPGRLPQARTLPRSELRALGEVSRVRIFRRRGCASAPRESARDR